MSKTAELYQTHNIGPVGPPAPLQAAFAGLDAPTDAPSNGPMRINVNVTNDNLLLALDGKQARSLFYALDVSIARFREKRENYRAQLAAEPFHAARNESAIAEFTEELRTLWGLYADIAVFAGYPPVCSFDEWEAGQAFGEARETGC